MTLQRITPDHECVISRYLGKWPPRDVALPDVRRCDQCGRYWEVVATEGFDDHYTPQGTWSHSTRCLVLQVEPVPYSRVVELLGPGPWGPA